MATNIELKARCGSHDDLRQMLAELGAEPLRAGAQKDEYLPARDGIFKIRRNDDAEAAQLIHYLRLAEPVLRGSEYHKIEVEDRRLETFLRDAFGTLVTVEKTRRTFRHGCCLVHLDTVRGLGAFVEIEAEVERAVDESAAEAEAVALTSRLGIAPSDLVPWSYSDFLLLTRAAERRRAELGDALVPGSILLIDGASGTGKSTILDAAQSFDRPIRPIRRLTTRPPRADGKEDHEQMRFLAPCEFRRLIDAGEVLEYRDFLFGMSYGLPWAPIARAVLDDHIAVGLINLGNGRSIKEFLPEAVTVLIDAPLEEIEERLHNRGTHTPGQVEERLENARKAKHYGTYYDHVIANNHGHLDASIAQFRSIVASHSSR